VLAHYAIAALIPMNPSGVHLWPSQTPSTGTTPLASAVPTATGFACRNEERAFIAGEQTTSLLFFEVHFQFAFQWTGAALLRQRKHNLRYQRERMRVNSLRRPITAM